MKRNSILLLLLFAAAIFSGEPIKMHCYKVVDGDTIYGITEEGDTLKVRLWGIDCPERGQPYGDSATQFVKERCEGKQVSIHKVNTDRYGRIVAKVSIEIPFMRSKDSDNPSKPWILSLEEELLRQGLAWWSKKYAPKQLTYMGAEEEARKAKKGLWGQHVQVAPWKWRKLNKRERDSVRALNRCL